jgi:hypothetical protein
VRSRVAWGLFVLAVLSSTTASAAPATSGEFVALTYNVAGLSQAVSGEDPETNSPLISPLLNAYDLVLLQEDWEDPIEGGPNVHYHEEIVADANHPYRSDPAPAPLGTDLRRFPHGPPLISDGLNRLSRFPFGTLERHMWEECNGELAIEAAEQLLGEAGLDEVVDEAGLGDTIDGGAADCAAQKGFSVARTKFADGVEVDVYNLHADAGGGAGDIAARQANFPQLAAFVKEHSAGRAVIVGGDTNLRTGADGRAEDKKMWEDFQAATGLLDVCRVADCGADAHVVDKFFFREGGGVALTPLSHHFERERFKRSDGEPLSDHDPLAVRFAWDAGDPSGAAEPELPVTGGPGAERVVALLLIAAAVAVSLVRRRGSLPSRAPLRSVAVSPR